MFPFTTEVLTKKESIRKAFLLLPLFAKIPYTIPMLIVAGGPMFAGKTTWLLDYAKKLPQGSFRLYKPHIDNRYADTAVVSHNGDNLAAINIDNMHPAFSDIDTHTTHILIDEANFFDQKKLIPLIKKQLKTGRHVVAAGLLYDFLKKPFGATLPLSKMADEFVELFALCDKCGKKAMHSYRKTDDKKQLVVGAATMYGPCCLTCWEVLSKK